MTWSGPGESGGRRGYHHGNLREALIDAAVRLIAEKGPAGFTIAEAARAAGVSPAAPYRHFRDAEALLADVATRGFERFTAALTTAWNGARPDPVMAFGNLGRAYLGFARQEPGYYAAMFDAGLPLAAYPPLLTASDQAFAALREATEVLCNRLSKPERPPALMVALHVWALAHGIASLFGRGDAARRKLPMSPDDLLEAGFLVYLRGLGLLT
jgi:AcrR family transcriptional regulator